MNNDNYAGDAPAEDVKNPDSNMSNALLHDDAEHWRFIMKYGAPRDMTSYDAAMYLTPKRYALYLKIGGMTYSIDGLSFKGVVDAGMALVRMVGDDS